MKGYMENPASCSLAISRQECVRVGPNPAGCEAEISKEISQKNFSQISSKTGQKASLRKEGKNTKKSRIPNFFFFQ